MEYLTPLYLQQDEAKCYRFVRLWTPAKPANDIAQAQTLKHTEACASADYFQGLSHRRLSLDLSETDAFLNQQLFLGSSLSSVLTEK